MDWQAEIYARVNQENGVLTLFLQDANKPSHKSILQYCDFLIVGESTPNMEARRKEFAWQDAKVRFFQGAQAFA